MFQHAQDYLDFLVGEGLWVGEAGLLEGVDAGFALVVAEFVDAGDVLALEVV